MYDRAAVLAKTAGVFDRFTAKKMTKADVDKLNALLDQHGIPRNNAHPGVAAELEAEASTQPSKLNRATDFVKEHKGKFLLGGLGLGGALWAAKKYQQSKQEQAAAAMDAQQGF